MARQIAEGSADLFLEYRALHGYSEEHAAAMSIIEHDRSVNTLRLPDEY